MKTSGWTLTALALIWQFGGAATATGVEQPRPVKPDSFWDHQTEVRALVFSPDGRTMVTLLHYMKNRVDLWDARTMLHRGQLSNTLKVRDICYSPNGRWIATTADARENGCSIPFTSVVVLWDAATARKHLAIEVPGIADEILFPPDGQYLAIKAHTDKGNTTLTLWHPGSNTRRNLLTGDKEQLYRFTFSPDGRTLALVTGAAGSGKSERVRLFEAATGKARRTLFSFDDGRPAPIVSFAPDGRTLVASISEVEDCLGELRWWDVLTGKEGAVWGEREESAVALAFSPDARTLASVRADGTIRLRDWPGGRLRLTLQGTPNPDRLSFSPDGKTLAVVEVRDDKPVLPIGVRLWDLTTGKEKLSPTVEAEYVRRAAVYRRQEARQARARSRSDPARTASRRLRHAEYALTMSRAQGAWQRWEFRQARELLDGLRPKKGEEDLRGFDWHYLHAQLPREVRLRPYRKRFPLVAFAPGGGLVAVSEGDRSVTLYDTATGKKRADIDNLPYRVAALALSLEGEFLAVSGTPADEGEACAISLWDVQTRKLRCRLKTPPTSALAFAASGQTLAGFSGLKSVSLWRVPDGKLLRVLRSETGLCGLLCFSPDGASVYAGWESVVSWDVATGKQRGIWEEPGALHGVMAPDGRLLACAWNEFVAVRVAARGTTITSFQGEPGPLLFADEGRLLVSGLSLFDPLTGERRGRYVRQLRPLREQERESAPGEKRSAIRALALSATGRVLAVVADRDGVHLLDLPLKLERLTPPKALGEMARLIFSADGRDLIARGHETVLKRWDAATAKERPEPSDEAKAKATVLVPARQGPPRVRVEGEDLSLADYAALHGRAPLADEEDQLLALSPDGGTLLTGEGARLTLRDARTGKLRATLPTLERDGVLRGVAFSPDSTTLATWAADVVLWDVKAAKEECRLKPPGPVLAVLFGKDGKSLSTLVLGDHRSPLLSLWDAERGETRVVLRGHADFVTAGAAVFSPDGRTLATGDRTGMVRLWDAVTGHLRFVLKGHPDSVFHLAFRTDGKALAAASQDNISLWTADR